MLKDIKIGQYIAGSSPLHRMEPRIKIILTILYIIFLFMINSPAAYIVCGILTAAMIFTARIPFKMMLKGMKPLLWLFVFTAVINIFMTQGTALWAVKLGAFELNITYEGIRAAVLLMLRLSFLVMGSSLLTLTTSPLQLADGIEKLLRPLKRLKVPAHEIAMMMTIAIRFIPTLGEETEKIMKAQKARGAQLDTGGIFKRAKAMIPVMVPLFISAFHRADDLAIAMDARCYNGERRTRMKETKICASDIAACIVFAAGIAVISAAEFLF